MGVINKQWIGTIHLKIQNLFSFSMFKKKKKQVLV